ncbi:hypothetical protein SFRURICE_006879 [Spodoptera frugiperda]|nr:hypothetical protein SFRURICE_006879 [Spodoptera frugiperda]
MKFLYVALLFALVMFVTDVAADGVQILVDGRRAGQICRRDSDCGDMCNCVESICRCFRRSLGLSDLYY